MTKDAYGDWDTVADNNSDIGGTNIAENCAPGNLNDAIRKMMAQLADFDIPGKGAAETVTANWTFSGDLTLSGANTFTGNNTFEGDDTISGNPTFSGDPAFTGAPDFSGVSNAATILSDLGAAPINSPTFTGTVGGVPGRLIGQWLRGSAGSYTYTPTAGTKYIWVRIAGGGGGGAGVGSGGSTYSARVGGGGGSGGYCEFFAAVNFASYSVRLGAGGAGGSGGGSGGQNSWIFPSEVDKPSLWVDMEGGSGGETTNGSVGVVGPGGNGGNQVNIGGTDLVWSYFQEGGTGGHGTASPRNGESSGGYAMGGFGGFTPLGELENGPTVYASSSQSNGVNGNRGGCGGCGACSLHGGGSAAGGDGAAGAIIIFEFGG